MATVGSLNIFMNADASGVSKAFAAASNSARRFEGFLTSMSGALTAVTTGAFALTTVKTLESIDAQADLATRIGTTTEALSRLQFAGTQTGTSAEKVADGIARLSRTLGEASAGSGPAAKALTSLGLSAAQLSQQDAGEAFKTIAQAISELPTPAAQAAAAVDLFGRSGADLVSILSRGRAGIEAFGAQSDALGFTLSTQVAEAASRSVDAIERLKAASTGAARIFAASLAPSIEKVANAVTGTIMLWNQLDKSTLSIAVNSAKWVAETAAAVYVMGKVVQLGKLLVATYKSIAQSQAVMMALTGPKGWAMLAAGAVVAAGALYAVDKAFQSIGNTVQAVGAAGAAVGNITGTAGNGGNATALLATASATNEFARAQDEANKTVWDSVWAMKTQLDQIGMTSQQIKILELQTLGADAATVKLAESIDRQIEARKAYLEFGDLVKQLELEAATFGMTANEATLYALALRGVSEEAIAHAKRLMDEAEARKKFNQQLDEGRRLTESLMTSEEKYVSELARLDKLLADGAIDRQTYERGIGKAYMDSVSGLDMGANDPLRLASSNISRFDTGGGAAAMDSAMARNTATNDQKQVKLLEEHNKKLTELIALQKNNGGVVVMGPIQAAN